MARTKQTRRLTKTVTVRSSSGVVKSKKGGLPIAHFPQHEATKKKSVQMRFGSIKDLSSCVGRLREAISKKYAEQRDVIVISDDEDEQQNETATQEDIIIIND
jgi:hypothetical protein